MKKSLIAICASVLLTTGAFAQSEASQYSVDSAASAVSMVAGSVMVVAMSPVLSVMAVSNHSQRQDQVMVQVKNEAGATTFVPINRQAAERAGLKPGDVLNSTPRKSGTLLNKSGKPVAFLVPEQNATLSKSEELKR